MGDSFQVRAPMQALVVSVRTEVGQAVTSGQTLVILEAMKMEHIITAEQSGIVTQILTQPDAMVAAGDPLVRLERAEHVEAATDTAKETSLDDIRPDLAEVSERHAFGLDENRPDAVAKRRQTGQRTARENVADLVDEGTLVEYGALVIAAQRRRRPMEDLIRRTPADGMVAGIGRVNGELFGDAGTQCAAMSYDYTVLAGTQGTMNHLKKDRMFELAEQRALPVVLFSEGGGGRPGDTDHAIVAGLDCRAFQYFAELSGKVPLVGVNSGRCFAGNAALLGCCDVVIATKASNIGMGGPAMIEGGGLGVFTPEEIGPSASQYRNGVIDVLVNDDVEAVAAAKKYLSYFQGAVTEWSCADQRLLRSAIPENRLRVYDVRTVVETLADADSVLELTGGFGAGMVTTLARIEGRPVGIIANDPKHLGGAIDGEAADKASGFMTLCSTFGIPLVFLCDTPGFMVGPEAEETGLVKRAAALFTTGASLEVPFCTIVLRKGYGLGAQSMAGGSFKAPAFTISWPTGEFGGMGLEGAVKLGFRKELESIADPEAREKMFQQMVDMLYERGKAVNMAAHFEIDAVIDPVESRRWILSAIAPR
ncbi:MAG: biotin carboxylase [Deltaproteobacteria bacterium]|nr:biotin carboxylase [Deltaproteobacteria bacterium]